MAATTEDLRARAFEPGMARRLGTSTATPSWDTTTERRIDDGQTLARFLGWFSIGLGVLEIAATEQLCDYLGLEDREGLIRLYGAREIAQGIAILNSRQPEGWIKARIAGDVLDLATLAAAFGGNPRKRDNVVAAIAAVAGVTLLDILCARQLDASQH